MTSFIPWTGVVGGTYTNPSSLTVQDDGRIQSISAGGSGPTGVSITAGPSGNLVVNPSPLTTTGTVDINPTQSYVVPGSTNAIVAQWFESALAGGNLNFLQLGAGAATNNSTLLIFSNVGGTGSGANLAQLAVSGHTAGLSINGFGQVYTPNVILDDSSGLIVQTITGSGNVPAIESIEAGLNTGGFMKWILGKGLGPSDSAFLQFTNTGGIGSTTNIASFGCTNASGKAITIDGLSQVTTPFNTTLGTTVGSAIRVGANAGSNSSFGFSESGGTGLQGAITLVGGTATVTFTAPTVISATSRIFLCCQVPGGTPGWLQVSARTPGNFTILSSSGTDTSSVGYVIFGS